MAELTKSHVEDWGARQWDVELALGEITPDVIRFLRIHGLGQREINQFYEMTKAQRFGGKFVITDVELVRAERLESMLAHHVRNLKLSIGEKVVDWFMEVPDQ